MKVPDRLAQDGYQPVYGVPDDYLEEFPVSVLDGDTLAREEAMASPHTDEELEIYRRLFACDPAPVAGR